MAWRYPRQRLYEGDIAEPSDLRENLNELNSEFNGYLDSDNFREDTFDTSRVQFRTFNEVHSSMKWYDPSLDPGHEFSNPWKDKHSNVGWHYKNEEDDTLVNPIIIDVEDDCMIITEFGVSWKWQPVAVDAAMPGYGAGYLGEVYEYYKKGSAAYGSATYVIAVRAIFSAKCSAYSGACLSME